MPATATPGQGRLVEVGDTRLFVVERAPGGYPLVCLHGGPGLDHWMFADYLDPLTPEVRLILVDQRGHGMSDPAPVETFTIARLAEDVVRLADVLELREYAVLGHSFGGFVALRLAVDHPDAAAALVLVDTVPSIRFVRPLDERTAALPDELRKRVLAGGNTRDELDAYIPLCFADLADPRIDDFLRRTAAAVQRSEPLDAFRSRGYDHELEDRLDRVRARTLVLAGRHDRICPPAAAEAMAAAIPGAEHRIFERSGHLPFVEEQDAFLDAVRRFLTAAA